MSYSNFDPKDYKRMERNRKNLLTFYVNGLDINESFCMIDIILEEMNETNDQDYYQKMSEKIKEIKQNLINRINKIEEVPKEM